MKYLIKVEGMKPERIFGISKTGVATYQMADLAIFSSDFPQPLWGIPLAALHCIRSRIHENRNSKVFKRINPFPVYMSKKNAKIFKRKNAFPVYMSKKIENSTETSVFRGGLDQRRSRVHN